MGVYIESKKRSLARKREKEARKPLSQTVLGAEWWLEDGYIVNKKCCLPTC